MRLHPHFVVDTEGRRTGVLLTPVEYERIMEILEDQLDAADLDQAVAGETDFVPYERVREELHAEGQL